jgi:non-heme chloroperoxidase
VVRYIGRHGTKRVAKAVLIGAVPPLMLKTDANPGGLPIEVFDGIRAGVLRGPFAVLQGPHRDVLWVQSAWFDRLAGPARLVLATGNAIRAEGVLDCIKAFSETDFTEDLKKIDVPTLIIHGDDDQIVPIADSAMLTAKLVKEATLKVYPGASHGLCSTHKNQLNADLLAFLRDSGPEGQGVVAGFVGVETPASLRTNDKAGRRAAGAEALFPFFGQLRHG